MMPLMLVGFALIAALTCDVPKTAGTCGSASQDEVSPVRLSGGVFDEANAPVAGARVLLLPEPRQPMTGPPPQTMTDLDGRFSFARVPPGQYRVDTQKPGFVRMADVVSLPRIDLAAGQAIDGVVLYLRRGGVITGRVLDPGGQPLAEARVMAVRRLTAKGSPDRLVPAGQGGVTNDLGEFRIIGLLPGAYYVSAAPRMPTAFETPGRSATTMIATFFPGTPGASGAQAVTVASAQTVPDIIFRLESVAAFVVSGVAVDEDGRPAADVMIELIERPPGTGAMPESIGRTSTDEGGRFVIGNVPNGTFALVAMLPLTSGGANREIQPVTPPTQIHVTVANADLSDVRVVVRRRVQ